MVKRIYKAGTTVGLVAAVVQLYAAEPIVQASPEDMAAITAFNTAYLKAINEEDIAALSALTTDEHMMIAPNGKPIVGKAANDELNGRAFRQFEFDEHWYPEETVVDGNLAYQRGTYLVVAKPRDGGAERRLTGTFMRIYKKLDGQWRMVRDMFNSDGTSQNPASAPAPE
ncbi:MAG: nuclear transport factor 2 family protein [Gammaproteobacteria bacterium]|nr:nuclear transport factor 2 family protein [Gammaproteobacteria bacterium]